MALTKVGKEGVTGISNSSNATAITIDSSENVGIGTASPDSLVHLSGANPKLHIRNSSDSNRGGYLQDNGSTFVLGSNSGVRNLVFSPDNTERMRIDSSGHVTKSAQPAFQAVPASNQNNIATGTDVTIIFGTERFDVGSNFASNTFTAPVTGKYYLDVQLRVEYIDTAANYYQLKIQTTNHTYVMTLDPNFSADMTYGPMSISIVADMDANDTTLVKLHQSGGTAQSDIDNESYFSGYLLG